MYVQPPSFRVVRPRIPQCRFARQALAGPAPRPSASPHQRSRPQTRRSVPYLARVAGIGRNQRADGIGVQVQRYRDLPRRRPWQRHDARDFAELVPMRRVVDGLEGTGQRRTGTFIAHRLRCRRRGSSTRPYLALDDGHFLAGRVPAIAGFSRGRGLICATRAQVERGHVKSWNAVVDGAIAIETPDHALDRDDVDRHPILADNERMGDPPVPTGKFRQLSNTGFQIEKFLSRQSSVRAARKETYAPPANPGHSPSRFAATCCGLRSKLSQMTGGFPWQLAACGSNSRILIDQRQDTSDRYCRGGEK